MNDTPDLDHAAMEPPWHSSRDGAVRSRLASLEKVKADEVAQMPMDLGGDAVVPETRADPASRQLVLPDLFPEKPPIRHASYLTALFLGGSGDALAPARSRHGAPYVERLFVELLSALAADARDGAEHRLLFPHLKRHEEECDALLNEAEKRVGMPMTRRDSIERMLFGDAPWTNLRRDWASMRDALLNLGRIYLPLVLQQGSAERPSWGRYAVQLMAARIVPANRDARWVEVGVVVPGSARWGGRLDRPTLRGYGMESKLLYRLYLLSSAYKHRNARNGNEMTRRIDSGLLKGRKPSGKVVANPYALRHPPPWIDPVQAALAVGLDGTNRMQVKRVLDGLCRLEADGVLEIEYGGGRHAGRLRLWGGRGGAGVSSV